MKPIPKDKLTQSEREGLKKLQYGDDIIVTTYIYIYIYIYIYLYIYIYIYSILLYILIINNKSDKSKCSQNLTKTGSHSAPFL